MKRILLTTCIIIVTITFLMSCTDASRSKMFNLGDAATIKCYSGGVVIFDGKSTGKIKSEKNSDGYYFRDASDNRLKEVSGNCVISYQ